MDPGYNQVFNTPFPGSTPLLKAVTFGNTAADVDLFTVTGDVVVKLIAICETSLASGGGCNVSVGVTGDLDDLIALTDCLDIDAGNIWHDNAPDESFEWLTVAKEAIIANGLDIIFDVEGSKQVDSGVINFYLWWAPISADGNVVVA